MGLRRCNLSCSGEENREWGTSQGEVSLWLYSLETSITAYICAFRLVANKPLSKPIVLGSSDSLKILLTAKEDKKAKRPHQAFLAIKDVETGLDTSFVFSVRENGKAKLDVVSRS